MRNKADLEVDWAKVLRAMCNLPAPDMSKAEQWVLWCSTAPHDRADWNLNATMLRFASRHGWQPVTFRDIIYYEGSGQHLDADGKYVPHPALTGSDSG